MADNTITALNRCLNLVPIVRQHQGITIDELSRRAQSPRAQVLEDLSTTLLMCGVPPYFPHDYICFSLEGDRVHLAFADHFRRPVSLDALEALALKIACESTAPAGARPASSVQSVLRKVEEAMGPKQRALFKALSKRTLASDEGSEQIAGILQRVSSAAFERSVIEIEYVAGRDDSVRTWCVHPYGGVRREGHWYLVALVEGEAEPRTFRLDRVRKLIALKRHFEIPAAVCLQDWSTKPLLGPSDRPRATVRFSGTAARWIRESAEVGSVDDDAGGACLWHPQIASEEALARVLLSFGVEFEVVAPLSLRQCVQRTLRAVAASHS